MFNQLFKYLGMATREPRTYELWVKVKVKGVYIVQETAQPVMTFLALSQASADSFARENGGYAVPYVGK